MPIERVPVVHKFGIISHSQRLELQERLLKQSYAQATYGTKRAQTPTRSPLEVTEEFVQQFNAADGFDEREKMEDLAYKMLHRIKRRAGLKDGGRGTHVDLPVAWTELSQLAQCKGKIQEDCLDVLITSLDQGPLERVHIPALFFLAETTLYWLRTDAVHQPYLRTGELKLLRMGQLVFMRLFYHHMAGQLAPGHEDFKNRLYTYLDGFSESQEAYNPYPNALLSMRYINEVGKMVIGDCNTEAGEVKEGDNLVLHAKTRQSGHGPVMTDRTMSDDRHSSHSGAISSSVHDLSPTLWHALDVWRCVRHLGDGLGHALTSLASCGMGLASESWVDGVCAMSVLSDAAKANLQALRTLQNLARGVPPSQPRPHPPTEDSTYTRTHDMLQTEPGTGTFAYSPGYSSEEVSSKTPGELQDQFHDPTGDEEYSPTSPRYKPSFTPKKSYPSTTASPVKAQSILAGGSETESPTRGQHRVSLQEPPPSSRQRGGAESGQEGAGPSRHSQNRRRTQESQLSMGGTETMPNTARKVEVGSDLNDGRLSQTSSVPTYTNEVHPDLAGLNSWHWEVAITYAEILSDVCLHGNTSNIQKMALVGRLQDVGNLERASTTRQCPLVSAGLLDMAYFRAAKESNDGGPNDWSWRVRYAALQGLVKLCRCCAGDATKEGLRTVAWNTLVHVHSSERDMRVLEALKVGQVDANIENLLSEHLAVPASTIGAKMAGGLARLYLPPLPAPVDPPPSTRRRQPKPVAPVSKPTPKGPLRTSLREEIMLATALHEPGVTFGKRTDFDLHRIVEDQWRKEQQRELEGEEDDRKKALTQRQKEEEDLQRAADLSRRKKLGSKYPGTKAYDLEGGKGSARRPSAKSAAMAAS